MDAVSTYAFANFGWLSLQAIPLIVWPGFIASLLRDELAQPTILETYFARSLGLALFFYALVTVVLSGALPIGSDDGGATPGNASPFADAAIFISALHHASAGAYCYTRFMWSRQTQTAFAFGTLGSALLACMGLWCVMFAGDKGRRSKKMGYDKDTSSWPFKNTESYRSKKKGL